MDPQPVVGRGPGTDPPAPWDLRVLGPVELVRSGTAVELGKPMQRTLLGLLALRAGRVVSRSALVDALWDDDPPPSAVKTLHAHVSRLRRSLAAAGLADLVRTRPPGYLLDAPADRVDATRFDRLVESGRDLPARESAVRLRAALDLWRGDVLAGSTLGDWARAEAARLAGARLYAAEELFEAELASGRHARVATELEVFVAAHPLRERAWELLVLALALDGRPADALAAYRRARAVLAAELGVDPGPALRRLEASILAGGEPDRRPRPGGGRGERPDPGLPAPVTSLVGRDDDIAELAALLGRRRLVTLTGVGGCGKTRLAIAVAGAVAGPVGFVDLTGVTDPDRLPAALGDALGVRGEPSADALVGRLRPAPMLLVLDNCEQVAAGCAVLVERLLHRCPGLRVLATSRQALAAPGETVWPVQPLPVPTGPVRGLAGLREHAATRLFLERAALPAVRCLRDADAPAVVAICAGLDGLPLALELAAARTAVLTVADIARRLRDPALLSPGPAGGGLDAAVSWSYQGLDPAARRRFRQLSVLAGGGTLAAVAAVWDTDPDRAVDALGELVARSLVVVDHAGPQTRYRMLELIRHGAATRLAAEPAEQEAARRRHAEHHLAVAVDGAGRLRGTDSARWVERLAADHDNLRAALAWYGGRGDPAELRLAVALARYCRLRGRYREGRRWLTDALSRPGAATGPDRARGLLSVAFLAHFEGSYADAERYADAALTAHRGLGDPGGTARCLRLLGSIATERGDYDRAGAAYAEAGAAYAQLRDPVGQADVLQMTGFLAWLSADLDRAGPLLDRALRGYAALADAESVSSTRVHLAAVALHRDDLVTARWLAEQALAHFGRLGFREGIGWALDVAGRVATRAGEPERAVPALLAGLAEHWEVGDRWRQASVLDALAAAYVALGEPVRAAPLAGLADGVRAELGVPVPLVERAERAATQAVLAERLTGPQRYTALMHGSALTVPDVLAGTGAAAG